MLKATRRRLGSPTWLAVGLVILVPALAEAQVFPNRTIRRERPSPAMESPYIGQVRRDYYGYFPTCWNRFPAGWQCPCPNPEQPNREASFDKIKFNEKRAIDDSMLGPMDENDERPPNDLGPNPAVPGENPAPPPNTSRSPFEMATPKPRVPRSPTPDPFTDPAPTPKPGPGGSGSSALPAGNRPTASTGLMEMPRLPATAPTTNVESNLQPGAMELAPDAVLTSNNPSARPDLGPLPSAPTPASTTPMTTSNGVESEPIANMPAPAAQAPRRRSLIGSLFGRNNSRTR